MARSFSIVDHKVAEADFFLSKIPGCGYNIFAVQCYVAAFVASGRSITFALQSVLADADSFKGWYKERREKMRLDPLARFFHEFRRVNQHIGENLVRGGRLTNGEMLYSFLAVPDLPRAPKDDVYVACRKYMVSLVGLVYECYVDFGPTIDGRRRYTKEYFKSIGKTIEDAEEGLGFPRGWTDIGESGAEPYRWQALRDMSGGCEIDHIFEKYLGKVSPCPERLSPYMQK